MGKLKKAMGRLRRRIQLCAEYGTEEKERGSAIPSLFLLRPCRPSKDVTAKSRDFGPE